VNLLKEVNRAFLDLRKQVKRTGEEHPDLVTGEDQIIKRLVEILDGKVGERPSPDARKEAEKWATTRIDQMVPPGFADKKKEGDRKLGDALIWKEVLDEARQTQRPIIFITDDVKEDWWQRIMGKTIGPLPELKQELFDIAGKPFHMYQVEQFMKYAGEFSGRQVPSASLTEAAEVSARSKSKRRTSPFQSALELVKHSTFFNSAWEDIETMTLSPDSTVKIKLINDELQRINSERKALRNENVEPGTAMERDVVIRAQLLEQEDKKLRDMLSDEILMALGDSKTKTFHYGFTKLPSQDKEG
jgi:hypothetical protein